LKKLGKILLWAVAALVVLLVAAISLTIGWRPFIGPQARPLTSHQFERTPQRLERGKYLFTASTGCTGCHSLHDWNTHGGPVLAGGEGVGQVMWFSDLPGRIVAPNITPDPETGSGRWTDDQLARAIREGIGHDGRALFPMMPYEEFRHMSDEDLASIVVYMRSLPPVRHELPKTEIIFPVKYLIRNVPQPITEPVSGPERSDPVKWGQYLVTIASCTECHTPRLRGDVVSGMEYGGGFMNLETRGTDGSQIQSKNAGFGTLVVDGEIQYNLGARFFIQANVGGGGVLGDITAERLDGTRIFGGSSAWGHGVAYGQVGFGLRF